MVDKLEACPRCGGEAFVTIHYEVWCGLDRCLKLPARENRAEAVAAWNQRAFPANGEQVERVEVAERAFVRFNRGDEKDGPPSPYERAAVAAILSALPTPTEDARSRVKVLEEARKSAKALRDAAARSVKSGHRQAHLNLEMMAVALDRIDTALGNKETDRHG